MKTAFSVFVEYSSHYPNSFSGKDEAIYTAMY